ncbi:MAG: AsmA family protein [Beijerinckiaceae bacterium]|nr:AsmA family protein [Beijerinckiaceae bacterium]MCZ8301196.1 AsmA family protein [Beijerinckiaceae bacterium]
MRDLLTGLAALVALALIALMVGPHFVDWDSQRLRVAGLVSQRLGMPATISGPLSIRFLPTPTLDAERITLGPAERPVVQMRRLHLALSATALLSGKLAFAEAEAEEPVLFLEALRPWLDQLDQEGRAPALPAIGFEALLLDRLSLVEAPGAAGAVLAGPFTVRIEAPNLAGPLRIQGQDAGQQRDLKIQLGQFDKGRARLRGTLEDRAFGGRLALDGWFALPGVAGRPLFDGSASYNGNPVMGEQKLQLPFQGSARLVVQRNQMIADPVNLTLGSADQGVAWAGQAYLDMAGPRPRLKGRLDAKRIDGAALLGTAPEGRRPFRPDPGLMPVVPWLDGEVELGLGVLQLPGGLVQNVLVRAGFDGGSARLEAASADLPGGTRLAFTRAEGAGPTAIDGTLGVETEELHILAGWLRGGEHLSQLPQRARLGVRLKGDFAGIALEQFEIDSPAGQLRGMGRFAPASALAGSLPRLALDLRAERFDGRVLAALDPLRPVPGLDLSTRLSIARLVVDGRDMGGLDVDLERAQENGTLRHLKLTGPRGESILLTGTASGDGLNLTAKLDAPRLGELSRVAAALLPGTVTEMIVTRAAALEPALAVANIRLQDKAGEATWDVAFDGKFAGTEARGRSQSLLKGDQLHLSLEGRLANPDGSRLASQLSGVTLPAGEGEGLVTFRAEGNPRRLVSGQVEARLGQTEFRLDGGLNPFRSSPVEGRMTLATEDAGRIGRALIGNRATLGDGRPARIAATLRGSRETITLGDLDARLGDLPVRGEIAFDLTRAGQVAGQIRAGELSLEGMLAPATGRGWPDFGASWPKTGFGEAVRPPLAGDLWIEAERLILPGGSRLEGPQFVYRFGPDSAALEAFEARSGDARVSGGLTLLRKGDLLEAAGRLELARWPLAAPGGRLSGSLPFSASGGTWLDLVASLAGAGQLAFDDLVVAGLDPDALKRVSAIPIDRIDPVTELTVGALVDTALQQGEWRVPGRLQPAGMSNGQLRVSLAAEPAGTAGAEGVIVQPSILFDLVRREVEARFQLRQTGIPPGWRGAAPEIGLTLASRHDPRRPGMSPLQRRIDVASLLNGFLAMAIQRDLEKAEAFEADLRERAAHLRRQRADRFTERRQREIREVEAAIEQEAATIRRRAAAAAEFERQRSLREEQARQAELARRAEEERVRREAQQRQEPAPPPARAMPLDLTAPALAPPG